MFYSCSKTSKIIHNPRCGHLIHIPRENQFFFGTDEILESALRDGYGFCMDCSFLGRKLKKERLIIDRICEKNQIHYWFNRKDGTLDIVSRYDVWKIIVRGDNNTIALYHKNTRPYGTSDVPGYHRQKAHSTSLNRFFRSIVVHDEYRFRHPEPKTYYFIPPQLAGSVPSVPVKRKFFSHHHDIGHMVTNKKKKHKSRKARSQAERRSREELSANRVVALIEQWESERIRKTCMQDEDAKWRIAE